MVNHPNIVRLSEAFRRKEKLCLVFEFVDFSLLELIEKNPGGLKVASFFSPERDNKELYVPDSESNFVPA
jgi:serine/threonine protein kinase